ncbi:MAG: hypothetical protein QOH13_2613, partial [Thermoleophilaceae bacterium]|nr:hypothetical protein [Thermoleophilaceae bacterium]
MRRPPRPVVPLFLVALGCAALASSASAATYTVDDAGDGAGTCPGPGCTLRQAIDDANANAGTDTIDFDALVTQISPV